MQDPHEPPAEAVHSKGTNPPIRPFANAIGNAWNRSEGARLALCFRSLAFWIPAGIALWLISSLLSEPDVSDADLMSAIGLLVAVTLIAAVASRFASLSMIARQMEVSMVGRSNDWSPWIALKTAPFIVIPLIGSFVLTIAAGFLFEWVGVPESGLWDLFILPLASIPVVLALPVVWAANPFWIDQGAGALEGLEKGRRFLFDHRGGALTHLALIGVLFVGSMVFSPVWLFFDVLSKTSFFEAYRAAQGHLGESNEEYVDSSPSIVTFAELRRLRGEVDPE